MRRTTCASSSDVFVPGRGTALKKRTLWCVAEEMPQDWVRERDRKDEGGKTGGAPGTQTLRGHEEFRGKRSVGGVRMTANAERDL